MRCGNVYYFKLAPRVELQVGLVSRRVTLWLRGRCINLKKPNYKRIERVGFDSRDVI